MRSIILMAIKPAELMILRYPEPALRARANALPKIDDQVRQVAERMIELMHEAEGVGLAAPQVGLGWRMFVTNVPDEGGDRVYINPSLTQFSRDTGVFEEGCLSLPGFREQVKRANRVTVRAQDAKGQVYEKTGEELLARAFLHETDHLNGQLYISHISMLKRDLIRRKVRKLMKEGEWS